MTFFPYPDGIRLDVTNFWESRRGLVYDWEAEGGPIG